MFYENTLQQVFLYLLKRRIRWCFASCSAAGIEASVIEEDHTVQYRLFAFVKEKKNGKDRKNAGDCG